MRRTRIRAGARKSRATPSSLRAPLSGSTRDTTHIKFGAGEGIRTLDPDLGKVVLYP